jgi:hypothetical protein
MTDGVLPAVDVEIEKALTDLVMNCPELAQLEALLSNFNIFRVLRAARHEIRHSNMLAWIVSPDESHGLGDRFLRRWLMQVVHEAGRDGAMRLGLPSPIEIDALQIEDVAVAREDANIDLLLSIRTAKDRTWVICVENKVESRQHTQQLARYREIVERRFAHAEHRIFLLLSKHPEEPEDPGFVRTSYELVANVLGRCLDERRDWIGPEPRMLLDQYLELLKEDFVSDTRAAELARQIYKSHRKAIDFILENRDDPIMHATRLMEQVVRDNKDAFSVMPDRMNKGYVRFVPREWDVPQNRGGTGWGPDSRYLLCEINFWNKVELQVTCAKAPEAWADKVWARAAEPPFKQDWKKRPAQYVKPYKARSTMDIESLADMPAEDARIQLHDWLKVELAKPSFRKAVEILSDMLNDLHPSS